MNLLRIVVVVVFCAAVLTMSAAQNADQLYSEKCASCHAADGRGHTAAAFIDAVERTRKRKISVCAHVILGLPGEDIEDMLQTARLLASLDVEAVKIHLLYVIRGTALEEMYRAGGYTCLSRDGYAAAVGEFLALLRPGTIVQRLTGDPHPEELVAPAWALDKQRNLEAVWAYMEQKGLYLGISCVKNRFSSN